MKSLLPITAFFLLVIFSSFNANAQNVTVTNITGESASITGGQSNVAVLGFNLEDTDAGDPDVFGLTVTFSAAVTDIFTNIRLFQSTSNNFATATLVGAFDAPIGNAYSITFSSRDVPANSTMNFWVVADVDPDLQTTANISVSTTSFNITGGSSTGSATGPVYNSANNNVFQLTTQIGSLNAPANNVAANPLVAGSTGRAILGFSLSSNGSQTVTTLAIQLTADPSGKLGTFSLVRSTDADFATGGDNTTVPGLTFNVGTTQVEITGLNEVMTGSAKNYFLVANVNAGVTALGSGTITASLAPANVTNDQGYESGTATGVTYSFAEVTTTIGSLNSVAANKVAASPLGASSAGLPVLGFSLASNGSQTLSILTISLSSDPTGVLGSFSLVRSTDADFSTTGDNTVVPGLTFAPNATGVLITGLNESITTTAKNYFLVATTSGSVVPATPPLQASLTAANTTLAPTGVTGSATGINYSFTTLNATLATLTGGLAPSPLNAGATNQAVLGFSVSSTGSQSFTTLTIAATADPDPVFSSGAWSLVRSTDNDFSTAGDNTPIGGLTFNTPANAIAITGLNETVVGTRNYFLVATVAGGANPGSGSIQLSFNQGAINLTPGTVNNGTITGTNYSFALSAQSDLVLNGGTTAGINYQNFLSAGAMTEAGSASLATFNLRDGGSSANDGDTSPTILTGITFDIGNFGNLDKVGLFDAGALLQEVIVTSGVVVFSGLTIQANDNGNNNVTLRATFKTTVTDNQFTQVTVTSVTSSASGSSGFASGNGGGAATVANTNQVQVTANKLVFSNLPGPVETNTNFGFTVTAVDDQGNVDVDRNNQVTLSESGSGSFSGQTLTPNLSAGTFTWTTLRINSAGNYPITAAYGGLTSATGNLTIASPGVLITKGTLAAPLCYDGDPQPLTNITITEADETDFGVGTNQTLSLSITTGFEFDPTAVPSVSTTGAGMSASSLNPMYVYLSNNTVVRVSYSVAAGSSSVINSVIIGGLRVKYTGNANTTGSIVRIGGSAVIAGNSDLDGKSHADLSSQNSTTGVSFTVEAFPQDPPTDANRTSFTTSDKAVNLLGSVANSGSFSGNGVALTGSTNYTFSPSSAGSGSHPITYTVRESTGQACIVSNTKVFVVSSESVIQNLNPTYCRNSPLSAVMQVTPAQITRDFPTTSLSIFGITVYKYTYTFERFVWAVRPTFGFFWIPVYSAIPAPNNRFNPQDPSIGFFGTTVSVSYEVRKRTFDASDNLLSEEIVKSPSNQSVQVFGLPFVSLSIPKTEFCENELSVTLTGIPTPSTVTANDFFNATPAGTVSNTGGANWVFNPAQAGVGNNAVSVPITYTYRDPNTGCSNTTFPVLVTVYPVPDGVPTTEIVNGKATLPTTTLEVCQDEPIPTPLFEGTAGIETTYRWYSDPGLTTALNTGSSFSDKVSTATPQTIKYYVTQARNGCESRQAPRELTFIINPRPAPPASDFSRTYCQFASIPGSDYVVTGTNIRWYNDKGLPLFNGNNPKPFVNLQIDSSQAVSYPRSVTQTSNKNCESQPTIVQTTINPLPTPAFNRTASICETNPPINISATPAGGTWSGTASAFLTNTNISAGTTRFNPLGQNPGDYFLRYTFTNNFNCSSFFQDTITIRPTINAIITPGNNSNACKDFFIEFTNSSEMKPLNSIVSIAEIKWDFGDRSGLDATPFSPTVAIPADDPNNQGTFTSPSHRYTTVGRFEARVAMTTTEGCTVEKVVPIDVREVPVADFSYQNVCSDFTGSVANISFTGVNKNSNMVPSDVPSAGYQWNFDGTGPLTAIAPANPGRTPTVSFTNVGRDSVTLTLVSIYQCTNTVKKPIFVVPTIPAISESDNYLIDFNSPAGAFSPDGGWVSGGLNSSWEFGLPAGLVINKDSSATGTGNAWVTNLTGSTNRNEKSWVLSPCFNFENSTKPVISLDIYSATPELTDGAVLQYNTSDNIENEANWKVLGTVGAGINWYDFTGISSNPGNQSALFVGWTGNERTNSRYKKWAHAVYKLDELISSLIDRSKVKFRIAFASSSGPLEGFAFDNVFIGERTRNVLVENFVNTSSTASDPQIMAFNALESTSDEIVKLQYHTSFPAADRLYTSQPEINDSRTAFYGITNSPSLRIDGGFQPGPFASWAQTVYDNRILEPAALKIDATFVDNGPGSPVIIRPVITNQSSRPVSLEMVNLFTVVAEKTITSPAFKGSSAAPMFRYVATRFLPDPAGQRLSGELAPGESINVGEVSWAESVLTVENRPDSAAVIIYLQSLGNNNRREVLQSRLFANPSAVPNARLITGLEPTISELTTVYPNPADNELFVILPERVSEVAPVSLIDGFGRATYISSFAKGQHTKAIPTKELASGIYVLQVETLNGMVRKKVMIKHQ